MLAVTSGRVKGSPGDACVSYRAGDICNLCMDAACVQCIPVREWIYGVHRSMNVGNRVKGGNRVNGSSGIPRSGVQRILMLTDLHWT